MKRSRDFSLIHGSKQPGAPAIILLAIGSPLEHIVPSPMTSGKVTITHDDGSLCVEFAAEGIGNPGRALFVALDTDPLGGCAVLPYQQHAEGSTVFVPFRADRIYAVKVGPDGRPSLWWREWQRTKWSGQIHVKDEFRAEVRQDRMRIRFHNNASAAPDQDEAGHSGVGGHPTTQRLAVWAKDTGLNDGWGFMIASEDEGASGYGDQSLRRRYVPAGARAAGKSGAQRWEVAGVRTQRPRIYQLLPRLFSNTNETRKMNGTLAENGVGKFADINDAALRSLRDELGITHVWLTGVLAQATSTDYSAIGKPADDPDLLKGLAGSPYAIKDYGDVCPDYAVEPGSRMEEFKALLARAHKNSLRVIIDFVPNHVARSHPALAPWSFGSKDDPARFFDPRNNFFWLQPDSPGGGPPLRLPTVKDGHVLSPTCDVLGAGDGLFQPETDRGRVTGNNAATWSPSQNDWYETAKLNYGFDFTTATRAYPHGDRPDLPIPDTWVKMDAVLAHWQAAGVDGFRCDMAHMVPPEFWAWAIDRARARQPGVMFLAEAYNNDPMKVEGGYDLVAHFKNVMIELLNAGFDAVYDDPAYKALKRIYDGPAWANDLDATLAAQGPYVFPQSLRYAENHDEVRLAGKGEWGGIGMEVGRPVSGILFGISRGPVLLCGGQEVGEPADGAEGFGGDDARTTIFDYWSMPELAKWVNGHRYDGGRLSPQQKELRAFYGRLLKACGEPAFCDGEFFPLNGANKDNADFGRLGEHASGHWLHAFLRATRASHYLVIANLHRYETMHGIRIRLSDEARAALGATGVALHFTDKVGALQPFSAALPEIDGRGIPIPDLPPLSVSYLEISNIHR